MTAQALITSDPFAEADRLAKAHARTLRILDRVAPMPPLNLHSTHWSREQAERWHRADTDARATRERLYPEIKARIAGKLSDAELVGLSRQQRKFNRERGHG